MTRGESWLVLTCSGSAKRGNSCRGRKQLCCTNSSAAVVQSSVGACLEGWCSIWSSGGCLALICKHPPCLLQRRQAVQGAVLISEHNQALVRAARPHGHASTLSLPPRRPSAMRCPPGCRRGAQAGGLTRSSGRKAPCPSPATSRGSPDAFCWQPPVLLRGSSFRHCLQRAHLAPGSLRSLARSRGCPRPPVPRPKLTGEGT